MGSTFSYEICVFPSEAARADQIRLGLRVRAKPLKKRLVDREFMLEQILVELLSASANELTLWKRIEERMGELMIFGGCLDRLLRDLIQDGLITQFSSAAFAQIELTSAGIKLGQKYRRELYKKYWRARKRHPKRAEFLWRRQLIRRPEC